MVLGTKCEVREGPPLWPFGLADELHARLVGRPVALARVARDARAHDVFPTHLAAAVAREDVIQIQVAPVIGVAAVLAHVPIAFEYVVARELHLLARHPVKEHEDDHGGQADFVGDRLHHLRTGFALGKAAPTVEVVRGKAAVLRVDNLRMALAQKRKSPPG